MVIMDSSSSSDEELDLMALAVVIIAERKKKKHRIWVKEMYQNRKRDGINKIVSVMRVSDRESYFYKELIYKHMIM